MNTSTQDVMRVKGEILMRCDMEGAASAHAQTKAVVTSVCVGSGWSDY